MYTFFFFLDKNISSRLGSIILKIGGGEGKNLLIDFFQKNTRFIFRFRESRSFKNRFQIFFDNN